MKRFLSILAILSLFTCSIFAQHEEYGIASYYSDAFHGKPVASGELYNKDDKTAAHKSLPFGTMIKVTRLDNKKSVQVRVNDRGPHISGRIVDISRAAAEALDLVKDGTAKVVIEIVNQNSNQDPAVNTKPIDNNPTTTKTEPASKQGTTKTTNSAPSDKETSNSKKKEDKAKSNADKKKKTTPVEVTKPGVLVNANDYTSADLYQVSLTRPEKKGFGVQVAAFSSQDALFRRISELQAEWFSNIMVNVEQNAKNETQYKIILGPFPDNDAANVYKENLKKNKKMDGFVIDLSKLQTGK